MFRVPMFRVPMFRVPMFREFLKTFNRRLSVQINCHIPVPDKLIGAQAIIRKEY